MGLASVAVAAAAAAAMRRGGRCGPCVGLAIGCRGSGASPGWPSTSTWPMDLVSALPRFSCSRTLATSPWWPSPSLGSSLMLSTLVVLAGSPTSPLEVGALSLLSVLFLLVILGSFLVLCLSLLLYSLFWIWGFVSLGCIGIH